MRFNQQGGALILVLTLFFVMTESMFTLMLALRDQQIVINSFKMGTQSKVNMNAALASIEANRCLQNVCTTRYNNQTYAYSVEPVTAQIFRVTISDGSSMRMQSTVFCGKRTSWQLI